MADYKIVLYLVPFYSIFTLTLGSMRPRARICFVWKRNFFTLYEYVFRTHISHEKDLQKRNFSKTFFKVELFQNVVTLVRVDEQIRNFSKTLPMSRLQTRS